MYRFWTAGNKNVLWLFGIFIVIIPQKNATRFLHVFPSDNTQSLKTEIQKFMDLVHLLLRYFSLFTQPLSTSASCPGSFGEQRCHRSPDLMLSMKEKLVAISSKASLVAAPLSDNWIDHPKGHNYGLKRAEPKLPSKRQLENYKHNSFK